jgi:hypothetical protein
MPRSRKRYSRSKARRSGSRRQRRSGSRRPAASRRRRSRKVCPPGQISVRGHRSRSGSYVQPYCRDVSKRLLPRKKADCPPEKPLWTRGYYNAYGTYVRPHCTKIGSNRLAGQMAAYQASLAPAVAVPLASAPLVSIPVAAPLAAPLVAPPAIPARPATSAIQSLLSTPATSCYRYYR